METVINKSLLGLTLDFKKKRIRIHKKTYDSINRPHYFRILVNPATKCIVLETCTEYDPGSNSLESTSIHKSSIEMYSKTFMKAVGDCAGLEDQKLVTLYGTVSKAQDAVIFYI